MANNLTQPEFINQFFSGSPTSAAILDLSRRVSTILTDIAVTHFNPNLTSDNRHNILEGLSIGIDKAVRDLISAESPIRRVSPLSFLAHAYPEVVFPLGYDEVRYAASPIDDPTVSEDIQGLLNEIELESEHIIERLFLSMFRLVQFRSPNGVWHDLEGLLDTILPPLTTESGGQDERTEEEWAQLLVSSWSEQLKAPRTSSHSVLSLPALQVPASYGDSLLHASTKVILRELHNNAKMLRDIHWRTLEEIVAELLFDLGLDVTITERSNDGGRDVIARGELIPGEPMLLAVEVKHRRIVPVSEIRQALWANRHFPALLFVTSGHFSAGVYKERSEKEGTLRLYLKDGQGLSQWIHSYFRRNY